MKLQTMTAVLLLTALASSGASAATIQQTAQFDGVSPERLYEIYLSSQEHGAFTGAPAAIDAREGGSFSAFGGLVQGKILELVPSRLIVQRWKGVHASNASDPDTTLILTFKKNEAGAEIELVHVNVPDENRAMVNTHWNTLYWSKLRKYLTQAN